MSFPDFPVGSGKHRYSILIVKYLYNISLHPSVRCATFSQKVLGGSDWNLAWAFVMIRCSQLNKMVMIAPFFAPLCSAFPALMKDIYFSPSILRWDKIKLNNYPFLKIGSNIVVSYTVGSVLQCLLQILMFWILLTHFCPVLPRFAPFLKIGSNIVVPYTVWSVLHSLLQILIFGHFWPIFAPSCPVFPRFWILAQT